MPGLMNNSIEFRPTSVVYLFLILFAVFGLIFYLLAFSMGSMDIGVLISLSFLGFGVCSLWRLVKQKSVFNGSSRVFAKMKSLSILAISVHSVIARICELK